MTTKIVQTRQQGGPSSYGSNAVLAQATHCDKLPCSIDGLPGMIFTDLRGTCCCIVDVCVPPHAKSEDCCTAKKSLQGDSLKQTSQVRKHCGTYQRRVSRRACFTHPKRLAFHVDCLIVLAGFIRNAMLCCILVDAIWVPTLHRGHIMHSFALPEGCIQCLYLPKY